MSKSFTIDPNLIDWDRKMHVNKDVNDKVLLSNLAPLINGPRRSINVLSMPADKWIWERDLADRVQDKDFFFVGVERVADTRLRAQANARIISASYKKSIFSLALKRTWRHHCYTTSHKYDIIYADQMGTWCDKKYNELAIIFKRRLLADYGYLILTCGLGRTKMCARWKEAKEQGTERIRIQHTSLQLITDASLERREQGLMQDSNVPALIAGIPAQIQELASEYGYQLQLRPSSTYEKTRRNGQCCAPEYSLCFRNTSALGIASMPEHVDAWLAELDL